MKHIYTFVFLCVTTFSLAQSLSFSDALARMQGANQKLKGVEKQTQASSYTEKSMRGLYLPQLSINASYAHLSDPLSLSFNEYKTPLQSGLTSLAGLFLPLYNQLSDLYWAGSNLFLHRIGGMNFKNRIFGSSLQTFVGYSMQGVRYV